MARVTRGVSWQVALRARSGNESNDMTPVRIHKEAVTGNMETIIQNGVGFRIMRVFMDIVRQRLQRAILREKIGHEGDLSDSIQSKAWQKSGSLGGQVSFNYYGKFVDMGVGNGVTLSEASSGISLTSSRRGRGRRRRAKKWYSTTIAHERGQLAKIMAAAQATDLAKQTASRLRTSIEIKL